KHQLEEDKMGEQFGQPVYGP
ncbi:IS200/IS605 family transposase, partial [Salmonella enterica subsp. enterica serovar Reading]|nr:IS200/IS605 family transposase [Salmonella enterica]ECD9978061.1 IS200/IS605 family transposase [Salmonella enterica subsp. enterica]ECO2155279.1 IS200/IS605 family transposase [Salmonella enterica subsp. enterica serovar Brandenburg]EDP1010192.1 IS200/IS605 family transposase [Salmonella enterica subsp. enterica serovar Reading]EAP1219710.1 IS200/IS605 family transposase [Salmonella enterica]